MASAIAAFELRIARSVAVKDFNLPPKAPNGVLFAPTINTAFVAIDIALASDVFDFQGKRRED